MHAATGTDHDPLAPVGRRHVRGFAGMDINDSRREQAAPGSIGSVDDPRHDQVRPVVQPYRLPRRVAVPATA